MSVALEKDHPVQLVLGSLIAQEQLARKHGQLTFAVLCEDAQQWAHDLRDVLTEIATDAVYGRERCWSARSDGVITLEELFEVEQVLEEIETEAREGRII